MSTDQREDDTKNRAPTNEQDTSTYNQYAIVPAPRPQPGNVITARQERALRYLERKRARQERFSQQLPAVQSPSSIPSSIKNRDEAYSTSAQQVGKATIPTGQLELAPPRTVATAQSRRRRWHRKAMIRHISRKKLRGGRKEQRRSTKRFWLLLSSIFFAFLVVLLALSGVGAFFAYRFYSATQGKYIGQIVSLRDLMPRDNLKMYDSKNVLIAQLTDEGLHTFVPLSDISPTLVSATVSTEDKNFWNNPGIDLTRIIQAAIDNLTSGQVVAGGSTITQQLIKNLVVGNESTVTRKLQEVVLVPELNNRYTKSDIMEMYLNSIYYGEQAYGTDAAATVYFGLEDRPGKPAAQQLDL
ncbi:MAG TPA: transglycosylase domain-containing protein, partial [Ktedonobacteraceae bacterium]|nr:transglycosylase domain-containing protein [Ktedonobacteraceae bacterium]